MQISAAILTTEQSTLAEKMSAYLEAGFRIIDIDIQDEHFASDVTLSTEDTIQVLSELELPADLDLGFDLKVKEPTPEIAKILEFCAKFSLKPRIIVYHGSLIDREEIKQMGDMALMIGILGSKKMPKLKYIHGYDGVQVMTIGSEKQNAKLESELLFRADQLWGAGFGGRIYIDGGVNLKSAELIRAYNNDEDIIAQVSVGSYFQQAPVAELQLRMQKLLLALNI